MDYLEGTIKTITFYNEDNAFAILKVSVDAASTAPTLFDVEGEIHALKGHLPNPKKGERYRFYGQFESHPKYGEQFSFKQVEVLETASEEGIVDYLSSDLFKGIGEKTAQKVVDHLGSKAIETITQDPSTLARIPGLSKKNRTILKEGIMEHKASEQTLIKLYEYGVTPRLAKRLLDAYGPETLSVVRNNPYQLIDDIDGIGFERADIIAKKLGFTDADPLRIRAMVMYLFNYIVHAKGHTHIGSETFFTVCLERLNKNASLIESDALQTIISELLQEGKLLKVNAFYTTPKLNDQEQTIADEVLKRNARAHLSDQKAILDAIGTFELSEDITYTSKQREAIKTAMNQQMLIITGGPGTGKTTIVKGLVDVYKRVHKAFSEGEIHLIAPTGRAAKRMEAATNHEASTIHRFLGYGYDGLFAHGPNNKKSGSLFIIDETSMLDTALAAQLLGAIPQNGRIIMVGDDAQIPSVGAGQVLKDLIDSDAVRVVTLTDVHRQARESNIIHLAQNVREGSLPHDLLEPYTDRYVVPLEESTFHARLKSMIDHFMDKGYSLFEDIQVLIPMYKGESGIHATNRFLQSTYNDQSTRSVEYGEMVFKVHDKVLQLRNRIEDGVMNGDQGRIVGIEGDSSVIVDFDGKEVTYTKQSLDQLSLSYAMSVHKAQGSEYKVVIVPIFRRYAIMLRRKLIYTAITRSEEALVIAGEIDWLQYAVEQTEDQRVTGIKEKLNPSPSRAQIIEGRMHEVESTPASSEKTTSVRIDDALSAFDTLGEALDGLTPYDFMGEGEDRNT